MEDFKDQSDLLMVRYYVYALFQGEVLQYIGRSERLAARIMAHRNGKIRFDKVMALECDNFAAMCGLELELIALHNPPYNTHKLLSGPKPARPVDLVALGFSTKEGDQRQPMPRQPRLERHWRVKRRVALGG